MRAERAERSIAEVQGVQVTWEQELAHMGQAHAEQVRMACAHPNGRSGRGESAVGLPVLSARSASTQACGILKPGTHPLTGLGLEDSAGC